MYLDGSSIPQGQNPNPFSSSSSDLGQDGIVDQELQGELVLIFVLSFISISTSGMQFLEEIYLEVGLPQWLSGEKSTCQCRRNRFNPWVRKIPWRRVWQPTPVFLPGESPWTAEPGGLQSMGSQSVRRD